MPTGLSALVSGVRAPNPRSPTPLEATLAWLLGIALVVGVGLGVGAVAAALAIAEGLSAESAFALISDPRASPLVTSPIWISISIALNELTLVGLMWRWLRRLQAAPSEILPLSRYSVRAGFGAVLLPFGFAPLAELAAELVYRVAPGAVTPEHVVVAVARGTSPALLVLVLIAGALLPACSEEAFFRGFLTTAFRRYSELTAILLSSALFGLFHLDPTQAAGATVLGIAFGLVRLYTGSIWPCMLSHFAYNAGIILEARWFEPADDHVIHFGRVAFGLAISVAAYALLVGDLSRRHLRRLSFRPPAAEDS